MQLFIKNGRLRNRYILPLQKFKPLEGEYDIIWVQWVIGYLPHLDFVNCLNNLRKGLKKGKGVIIIKENTASEEELLDNDDNYIIRFFYLKKCI